MGLVSKLLKMANDIVSVIISTYNSSLYIVEALKSVFMQTWQELEVIVTDDCSGDDTVQVCRGWLNENKWRFIRVVVITSQQNTGISANANRGLNAAKGEWIKFLGADDTLEPNCIKDNMSFISLKPEVKVLFSRINIYRDTFEPDNLLDTTPNIPCYPNSILAPGINALSQYKMLLLCDRIHFSPSVFIHHETLISVKGFDERFKLLEDYPLWLNLAKNGHKLYFMEKVTVNYRRHSGANNNTGRDFLINPNYFRSEDFRRIYTYPNLPVDLRLNQRYIWFVSQIFQCNLLNRNNNFNRFLHDFLIVYLNPFRYYIWLRKKLDNKLTANEFYM
jgi:glycosyltransferase involved in cell wall biosynthesis